MGHRYVALSALVAFMAASAGASTRIVVTFNSSQAAQDVESVSDGVIIKQYGRRVVVDLGRNASVEEDEAWLKEELGEAVVDVELDALIAPLQFDNLILSEYLTVDNATYEDDMDAALVPGEQSPQDWYLLDSEPYGIHAESAWRITNSTPDVVVAVLDTGMRGEAFPHFRNIQAGYDFISDSEISLDGDGRDEDPSDPGTAAPACPVSSWHGLRTASILAASHESPLGVRGVAQNCSLMNVRVLGRCGSGYASDVTDAIVWSAGGGIDGLTSTPMPARVISMSFAGRGACPSYLQSAVTQAIQLGALLVAAAGNQGLNTTGYFPANCRGVLAISATTRQGRLAGYSNYGPNIALAAPGGDESNPLVMLSMDDLGRDVELASGMGTSFAVPQVAGVVSLMVVLMSKMSVENFIRSDLTQFNSPSFCANGNCGSGILDARIAENQTLFTYMQAPCSTGYYCPDVSTQNLCSAGYYCPNWFTSTICPEGSYCPAGSTAPLPCDTGDYCPLGSSVKSLCPAGYYCPSTVNMFGCFSGYYCPAGSTAYSTCPVGSYCPTAVSSVLCTCPQGQYKIGCGGVSAGLCTACSGICPAGQYLSGCSGISEGVCTACYSSCSEGQYLSGCSGMSAGTCIACVAGTYSSTLGATTSLSCIACSAGTYLTGTGRGTPCNVCPTGMYSNTTGSTTCTACLAGSYSSSLGMSSESKCTACAAGTYSAAGASSCIPSGIIQVPTNGTYCQSYYPGSYSEINGNHGVCLTGPDNCNNPSCVNPCRSASWIGIVAWDYCCPWKVNVGCSYGNYYGDSEINTYWIRCAAGCVTLGNCNNLPANAIYTGPGTSATDCPWTCNKGFTSVGSTCLPTCSAGYYYPIGSTVCTVCSSVTQAQCPNDYQLQACAAASDTQCVPCANKIDNAAVTPVCVWTCNSGSFKNSSGLCQLCRSGLVCATGNFTLGCTSTTDQSCSPCTNLPANAYYTTDGGQGSLQSPGQCNWACNAGFYATPQDTSCTPCPGGSYSAPGSTSCPACQAGTYSALGTPCQSCPTGKYISTTGGTQCLACAACAAPGAYRQGCGGSSAGTCISCSN